jgi:hypothetical protein
LPVSATSWKSRRSEAVRVHEEACEFIDDSKKILSSSYRFSTPMASSIPPRVKFRRRPRDVRDEELHLQSKWALCVSRRLARVAAANAGQCLSVSNMFFVIVLKHRSRLFGFTLVVNDSPGSGREDSGDGVGDGEHNGPVELAFPDRARPVSGSMLQNVGVE